MRKVKGSLDREDDFNGGPDNPLWISPEVERVIKRDVHTAVLAERERCAVIDACSIECPLCGAQPRKWCVIVEGPTSLCHDQRWTAAIRAEPERGK